MGAKNEEKRGRGGRKGASGLEYGIALGLIGVVAVAATTMMGAKVREISYVR